MCEIYGFCGLSPTRLNKYTGEFWLHSRVHQDGFGYYLADRDLLYVNPQSAMKYVKGLNKFDFTSKLALCHIRFKTHGPALVENCHPFVKSDIHSVKWTLIHNGYIEDTYYTDALCLFQNGETDSERILLTIVESINRVYEYSWVEDRNDLLEMIYSTIESTINKISCLGKVNLIFTDSFTNNMYVYANANSLYYLTTDNGVHISTTKLSDEDWLPVDKCKLHIFNNGERLDY